MMRMRFGVNLRSTTSAAEFAADVRRVDELGFDILAVPDHLGTPSPFPLLAAAATVSPRLRLRPYVLNAAFHGGGTRTAALLARDVATVDALSDGRVEVGIGTGWAPAEFREAGIERRPFAARLADLERLVVDLRARLADPDHSPRPLQIPVPIMVGAMSAEGLRIAAEHADIVAFSGLRSVPGTNGAELTFVSSADTAARVADVRAARGDRPCRFDHLVQMIDLDPDPRAAATRVAAEMPGLTADDLLDTPFALFAPTAEAAAEELLRRQQLYGFDDVVTHHANLEEMGQIIAAYDRLVPR